MRAETYGAIIQNVAVIYRIQCPISQTPLHFINAEISDVKYRTTFKHSVECYSPDNGIINHDHKRSNLIMNAPPDQLSK